MERKLIEINSDTFAIEEEFVRFFVLVGSKKAAIIDSGVLGENISEYIKSITDKELILINTHADGDHTAGNYAFSKYYIDERDYINCGMQKKYPDCEACFIKDNDMFDLGGRVIKIISAPGHTKGSVAVLDVTNRLLFSGDSVQDGDVFMFGAHRDVDSFSASLSKLVKLQSEYDVIIPSHGTIKLEEDYAQKVLSDWNEYRNGELDGFDIDMHGNKVKCYKGKHCGFLV